MAELRLIAAGLAGALALGGAAPARGDTVTAPTGWALDRARSAALNQHAVASRHFGAEPSVELTEAYAPAAADAGVMLIVTRSTANLPAADAARAAAIASALDEALGWAARSAKAGAPIADATSAREEQGRALIATAGGRDASAHVIERVRELVVADAQHLVSVTGTCVAREDAAAALVAACEGALATLDPGVAVADRIALAFPAADPVAAPEPAPAERATPTRAPAMTDGSKVTIPPIVVPPAEPETDRRPVYFGLGLVLLALVFWWNRRRRDRDDAEPKAPRARRPREVDGDADALHAAASASDEPNPEEDAP